MPKIIPPFGEFPALGPHGFTRIGDTQWAEAGARRTVVCVHGLTRNSRNFAFLAQRLVVQAAEIADCGHAPALMDEAQIRIVADFLFADEAMAARRAKA
jgi:hypothetical protein